MQSNENSNRSAIVCNRPPESREENVESSTSPGQRSVEQLVAQGEAQSSFDYTTVLPLKVIKSCNLLLPEKSKRFPCRFAINSPSNGRALYERSEIRVQFSFQLFSWLHSRPTFSLLKLLNAAQSEGKLKLELKAFSILYFFFLAASLDSVNMNEKLCGIISLCLLSDKTCV